MISSFSVQIDSSNDMISANDILLRGSRQISRALNALRDGAISQLRKSSPVSELPSERNASALKQALRFSGIGPHPQMKRATITVQRNVRTAPIGEHLPRSATETPAAD